MRGQQSRKVEGGKEQHEDMVARSRARVSEREWDREESDRTREQARCGEVVQGGKEECEEENAMERDELNFGTERIREKIREHEVERKRPRALRHGIPPKVLLVGSKWNTEYGHTKNYCNKNPACVKCANNHHTTNCPFKGKIDNVKCVNCQSNHLANYKGCNVRKQIQQTMFPALRQKPHPVQSNTRTKNPNIEDITTFTLINQKTKHSQKDYIDIMLILETHLTTKHYIKIPNYTIYDTKHPTGRAHGGTAVIIKNNIKHHLHNKIEHPSIQATVIAVTIENRTINFAAIFNPPKHKINKEQYKDFFNSLGTRFLAAGDYNAKHPFWGSKITTPRGRILEQVVREHLLELISTGEPTYWPQASDKTPDSLDFAISKKLNRRQRITQSCVDLSSDHSPIIISLTQKPTEIQNTTNLYNSWTDWNLFREMLEKNINCNISLKTPNELEAAVNHFNKTVQEAARLSTPTKNNKRYKQEYPDYLPAINKDNGSWARSAQEKANTFAEHLYTVFQPHNIEGQDLHTEIHDFEEPLIQEGNEICRTTANGVKRIIANTQNRKSPGHDLINGKIIKELPLKAIRFLTVLYNGVFRLSYVPNQWKEARIIMIQKPGKDSLSFRLYQKY
ncbi:RNA-directed DNA polymerase from mobile element jockey [Dufourea novaeangliae]|uniref:RNA-directed DNA polymerase from mobile element jockey n=1 Tax=Dufourea novaeangliae TaxID=178035 RepID=A0A154PPS7_DUFNO|nr:RNA-directed DNA polymerase from mobile element jockey [Dufourea novaeangliae]